MGIINKTEVILALAVKITAGLCLCLFSTVELVQETIYELSLNVVWEISLAVLATGIIMVFMALIGTYGIMRKNFAVIFFYSMVSLLLGLVLLALGMTGIIMQHHKDYNEIRDVLNEKFSNYYVGIDTQENINKIQSHFHCCGVDDYTYWFGEESTDVTIGCCKHRREPNCYKNIGLLQENGIQAVIYTTGCIDQVTDYFKNLTYLMSVTSCLLAFVPLSAGIVSGCLLPNRDKPGYDVMWP